MQRLFMIIFFLYVSSRVFTLEELQDFPVNIASILSPNKIIEYDIDSPYIGIRHPHDDTDRENVLKLLRSDYGHVIEASNRYVTLSIRKEFTLTKNISRATSFIIQPRGAGFIFKLGNRCLISGRSKLGLGECEDITSSWRHSRQVFMVCLLPNSMLKLFYEICDEDDGCESSNVNKEVDLEDMFEKSIVDRSLKDTLKPFMMINKFMRKRDKKCREKAKKIDNCLCK